jgi:hypothetical protein
MKNKLYKYHVHNHRRINHSLDVLEKLIRTAIATKDRDTNKALLPLYMLLLGACAEARLLKVLMEPNKFSQDEVTQILQTKNHKERWLELIKISFLKRELKPIDTNIDEYTLSRRAWHLYKDLKDIIENELKLIIELRNKLAHGQFEYPFKNWDSPYLMTDIKISEIHKKSFEKENLLTMILKRNILDNILNIVRDLGVSQKAFPRDFDKYYKKIQMLNIQVKTKKYEKYKNGLIKKYTNKIIQNPSASA